MTIATRKPTVHQLRRFFNAIRDGIPTNRAADSVGLDQTIADEPRMANAIRIAEANALKRWHATVNTAGEGYSVTETAWQDATQATANDGAPAAVSHSTWAKASRKPGNTLSCSKDTRNSSLLPRSLLPACIPAKPRPRPPQGLLQRLPAVLADPPLTRCRFLRLHRSSLPGHQGPPTNRNGLNRLSPKHPGIHVPLVTPVSPLA